ncbi:MAG: hypothetical protein ACW98D_21545, partial [Promethearchaeota archaeon]
YPGLNFFHYFKLNISFVPIFFSFIVAIFVPELLNFFWGMILVFIVFYISGIFYLRNKNSEHKKNSPFCQNKRKSFPFSDNEPKESFEEELKKINENFSSDN